MIGQKKVKNIWQISQADFPQNGTISEQLRFLIQYALLAPSSHNTQPWKFRISQDQIEVFADESRWLKIADADKREMYLSVGCALENLLIAAVNFGFSVQTDYFPINGNEELVVRITLDQIYKLKSKNDLIEFIPYRSTFHETFSDKEIPQEILNNIENCCVEEGINISLTNDENIREKVDDLIARSDAEQFSNPEFREELAYWIGQGVFGHSWLMSQIGNLAVAYLNLGSSTAKSDVKVLRSASHLGLLSSVKNDRISQVKTGQIFERIYLTARKYNLGVRPMSQIVEVPECREKLKKLIPTSDDFPQQPFLLGFAEFSESHTPRRSIEEVLIEE